MPIVIQVVLSILGPCAAAPATSQDPQQPFRVEHIDLRLRLDLEAGSLVGDANLRVRNHGAAPARSLSVLLNPGLSLTAAARRNGPSLAFQQGRTAFVDFGQLEVIHAIVALDRAIAPGAAGDIQLSYEGRLRSYAHTGMAYIQDSITSDFTILRRDANAFPLPGVPSLAALRAEPLPAFSYTIEVEAPRSHVVASGGRLAGEQERNGVRTWRFTSSGPAPYLLVTVAPYRVIERGGVRIAFFPRDSLGAVVVADRVEAALALLARWFGPLATPPAFTIMEIPEGFGSQASLTGGIIQTAAAFTDRDRLGELYHELSHLWNAPDVDVPSARWNEGLATFLQYRMTAELDGGDRDEALRSALDRLRAALAREPRLAVVPFMRYGEERMTDHAYRVGAIMFDLLFETLGAARFDAAYARLLRAHAAGVTRADLERAFAIEPAAAGIVTDWLRTTRWTEAIRTGATLETLRRGRH